MKQTTWVFWILETMLFHVRFVMELVTRGFNFFMIVEIPFSLFELVMRTILIILMIVATTICGLVVISCLQKREPFNAIVFLTLFVTSIFCTGFVSGLITLKFV